MTMTNIVDQLIRDESEVLHVYLDSKGIRTAGIGHNLEAHGIDWPVGTPVSKAQSRAWLLKDIADATAELEGHLPWTRTLSGPIYGALQNMTFNMGIHKLLEFKHMLAFVQAGNYNAAADAMKNSLWAKEVGIRAVRLEQQMRTVEWV
jgi:lysozyme